MDAWDEGSAFGHEVEGMSRVIGAFQALAEQYVGEIARLRASQTKCTTQQSLGISREVVVLERVVADIRRVCVESDFSQDY